MDIAKFSVNNTVLVNLLLIAVIIFGLLAMNRMPTELNPDVSFNWAFITVPYPGASPKDIESQIVDPIESEISDVDKIDEIQSQSSEGLAFILVKFEDMSKSEFNQVFNNLQSEVNKVDLPNEVENPIIDDFSSGDFIPVIDINMGYSIPEANAQKIADDLKKEIKDVNGVAKVQVSGLADREIWIEASPEKLNSFGITFEEIIFALKSRNLNLPAGNISIAKNEYLIRSLGEFKTIDEVANTIVRNYSGKYSVRVKDIANITDRRKELDVLSKSNGDPSITFSISKTKDASSIDVINKIKELIQEYKTKVPDGVEFSFFNDNSTYILRIVNILRNNAISGMILVFLILYLFMGKTNAFLATIGIPTSFLLSFGILYLFGDSFNGSSLFALVMVVGILVDDAIIVIENCHRYRMMGYNAKDAAILGTREVVAPIISSILTNVAAFLPLMLLPGIMGKFMRIIPFVFSVTIIASLFEALVILPSHYSEWTRKSKVYQKGEKKFFINMKKWYGDFLLKILRKRYMLVGTVSLVFIMSLGVIPLVGVELFPDEDFDQFTCYIKMPEGTSLEESNRIIKKFETEALKLPSEYVTNVVTNVGFLQDDSEWITRKNVGQIKVQLIPQENRDIQTKALMERMREATKTISGPTSAEFKLLAGGPPVGKAISVKVQGKYLETIKQASLDLQTELNKIKGAIELTDDYPEGKSEINININEDKAALYGFSAQYIALNVRYIFDGFEATKYRDGDDEIDVVVKYDEKYKKSIDDVLNIKLTNAQGQTVALRDMVSFEIKPGPTTIRRFDQKRTIMVTGDINSDVTTLDKVNTELATLFPKLEEKYPGTTFTIGGEYDEFVNTFNDITQLFVIGIIFIFLILGKQFNSYSQPLIILFTVPFGLIGAMIGLLISGNPFSITALFGFVALSGIVVNGAIVLIDFLNERRKNQNGGLVTIWRSIIEAGTLRLRPIILSSITTIFGLFPMAIGIGGHSLQWSPLATVMMYGLIVSTLLTLFVIPALIAILDDIKKTRRKIKNIS